MFIIKNSEQLALMRAAGRITAEALHLAGEAVRAGVSTAQLDKIIRTHIERSGARPSFLGYGGFPASACISVNEEVIHGILKEAAGCFRCIRMMTNLSAPAQRRPEYQA